MLMNLIVAGGGEGLYKNVYPVTQSKDPNVEMRIATVIDILPRGKLHPKTREILQAENAAYIQTDENLTDILGHQLPPLVHTAGVVMTPNRLHLQYAKLFTGLGIPVYVEKPVVTNLADLADFMALAQWYPKFVFAAEYCTEGKALGLLSASGAIREDDPRLPYLLPRTPEGRKLMQEYFGNLGRLIHIKGKLLEGEGSAGTADHRVWLLDGSEGGMIRDLLSHLFGPLYDAQLATARVGRDLTVTLGRYMPGTPLGTYRPLQNPGEGETYAKIEGKFITSYPGGCPFVFEVGKYWPHHDRKLELTFENGRAILEYEKPFPFRIEIGGESLMSHIPTAFYPALSFLEFRQFIEGSTHGHIGRAKAIVELNELARDTGLKQLGLL